MKEEIKFRAWHVFMDKIYQKIAYILPKRIIYWALIRAFAIGTTGEYSYTISPNLTVVDAAARLKTN